MNLMRSIGMPPRRSIPKDTAPQVVYVEEAPAGELTTVEEKDAGTGADPTGTTGPAETTSAPVEESSDVGTLEVSVDAEGATVWVGDIGGDADPATPYRVSMPPGAYHMEVRAPGRMPEHSTVRIVPGMTTRAGVHLIRIDADAGMQTQPPPAQSKAPVTTKKGSGNGRLFLLGAGLVVAGIIAWRIEASRSND